MELLQIADFLKNYNKFESIKRIEDNIFQLSFQKDKIIFDLNRNQSAIYTADLTAKTYNAPFDFMLKKYFSNAKITKLEVLKNNRILVFHTLCSKAYKTYQNKIYFEFTGKNTNAIITDENDYIIEALRHIDKSSRPVKIGLKLQMLEPFKMDDKENKIIDFQKYFQDTFLQINHKKLQTLKQNKSLQISKKIAKLKELILSLENEEELLLASKNLASRADVLFANLYQIKEYEREFELLDFEGQKLEFKLEKNAKQSANEYYKNAKKLKQKALNLHLQKNNLQEKINFYTQLLDMIMKTSSSFELEVLCPKREKKDKKEENSAGIANFYFDHFKICIGKNEAANEYLLKNTKKDDIWLHVKDKPSSHAFIISNKTKPNDEVLEFAAKLCMNFSNLNKGSYLVDYTSRKFVKIKQKAFVNYTNYKTLKLSKD